MAQPAVIEVDTLVKKYGTHTAVDGISFQVQAGEVFGLLGPNGAGKTTTIKVLTTLIPATSGRVRVAGMEIGRDDTAIRSILGYVPQALSADGQLTGRENLIVFGKLLGLETAERTRRIDSALSLLGLEDAADRLVATYSGGMMRRLEIGQSLLLTPRVLILDEPTVGLDPMARRSIWALVHDLRRRNDMTVLMTTHYMDEADNNCDRVAVMSHGEIVGLGTSAELKALVPKPDATLEDVFVALAGESLETGGDLREQRQIRRRARLG
jgi:ABC-2 type transport system ATP-binding protein